MAFDEAQKGSDEMSHMRLYAACAILLEIDQIVGRLSKTLDVAPLRSSTYEYQRAAEVQPDHSCNGTHESRGIGL